MHFNSILWEEQLRNKGLQREIRRVLSLHPPFVSVTPPLSSQPSGCPSFWPRKRFYSEHRESESHLALSSGAPMASESAGEPELWSPLSLPAGVGSHAV